MEILRLNIKNNNDYSARFDLFDSNIDTVMEDGVTITNETTGELQLLSYEELVKDIVHRPIEIDNSNGIGRCGKT